MQATGEEIVMSAPSIFRKDVYFFRYQEFIQKLPTDESIAEK